MIKFGTNLIVILFMMKIIKTKVKTFNGVVNTVFSDDKISKESIHCTCISAININLVMKMDKKNCPQILFRTI